MQRKSLVIHNFVPPEFRKVKQPGDGKVKLTNEMNDVGDEILKIEKTAKIQYCSSVVNTNGLIFQ